MNSQELRQMFFDFFKSKGHLIVPSAPMVVKNDPTLMFTNAGMNQFKDIFLGNKQPVNKRVANSQKCLRVSGKHNDLEEVGHDTYHHTMFEMLGNWSFGDYFKRDAINWAWEFLIEKLHIDKDRLYVTYFEGDESELLEPDLEAYNQWKQNTDISRILKGSKKDNFWEMGETGPCGPCSEIHVDIRDEEERKKIPGRDLVNKGHPHVIEIWNLVFIQYNRKADSSLEYLPNKHVDTGMGFERLCMVVQGKKSNYDTDIFQDIIKEISSITGKDYSVSDKWDVALRVVADHLRAVSFSIADGQLPSNNKAGYVIRRILRRAVRYGYNSLGIEEPFIYKLVPVLARTMGEQYPELKINEEQIARVVLGEEIAFLKTLGNGLKMIEKTISDLKKEHINLLPGKMAFEMFDTFGFPVDLTQLILKENNMSLAEKEYDEEMKNQKKRSRLDAKIETEDWKILMESDGTEFTGYTKTSDEVLITKFRGIRIKGKKFFQIVFNKTPFYAEAGGQVGDTGTIAASKHKIKILNTTKENDLIIHTTKRLPPVLSALFKAKVNRKMRLMTANNHTATHLIHFALRSVLGKDVEQKGSMVSPDRLRFDFSHLGKISKEELLKVEELANQMVRQNYLTKVEDRVSIEKAKSKGAMALFGEKYGDFVRVVRIGKSIELCGGTHVEATGNIGFIKIISEGPVAAGIRRLEAVTASKAEDYINNVLNTEEKIAELLKSKNHITDSIENLLFENKSLKKNLEKYQLQSATIIWEKLSKSFNNLNNIKYASREIEQDLLDSLKKIAFQNRNSLENTVFVLGSKANDKVNILVIVSEDLVKNRNLSAESIVKDISAEINGTGGGKPFLAAAGGTKPEGLHRAFAKVAEFIKKT